MNPHVLIVAEHTSSRFGGEAALPLYYYRFLRERKIPVWLLVHNRTQLELQELFPTILWTELGGYDAVETQFFIVGVGFNQSWVQR